MLRLLSSSRPYEDFSPSHWSAKLRGAFIYQSSVTDLRPLADAFSGGRRASDVSERQDFMIGPGGETLPLFCLCKATLLMRARPL